MADETLGLDILVIDDEKNIRTTVAMCLEDMGCQVTGAPSAEAARAALASRAGLAVVVVTAYATIDTAVEAIRRGAADYLPKPFTPAQIRHAVEQVAERQRLTRRL